MTGSFFELSGVGVYAVAADGPELRTGGDAVDLISAASKHRPAIIVIPVERLGESFFELRTRIAGELIQKFATYGAHVAIVGDISKHLETSESLRAFVAESNRGQHLWFFKTLQDLTVRLQARAE
jgi:hypothetical protein